MSIKIYRAQVLVGYLFVQEKKRAAERAKLLDQMDEEFGISSLVEKEMKPNAPSYTSRDLKGLKVAHDQAKFSEGVTTILTLADKGMFDEYIL